MPIDIFDIGFQSAECCNKENSAKKPKYTKDIQKLAERFISEKTEKNFYFLMKRCEWGLRSFIYNITGNDYDTNNIMSLTMEHVWFGIDSFNPEIGKFSTWMYTIAYNDTIRYFKTINSKKRIQTISTDLIDLYSDSSDGDCCSNSSFFESDDGVIDNMYVTENNIVTVSKSTLKFDMYDASVECMEYLPEHLKTVMVDRFLKKKKVNQISSDNNIPETSVNNWIIKGKQCLHDEIKSRYPILYDIYKETIMDEK